MRIISYNFLFVGLLLTFGLATSAFAKSDLVTKIGKDESAISVRTDNPMTVFVDGVQLGKTEGNQIPFEYKVAYGKHDVRVVPDSGEGYSSVMDFNRGKRTCLCLKTNTKTITSPCPYNISVTGTDSVIEGDLITFAAINAVSGGSTALNYVWKVTPENARITSGLGTPSITIDTAGLGTQVVRAEVEVTDGMYDAPCRQRIAASTKVEKPQANVPYKFDKWDANSFDDDKARLDSFAGELMAKPDAQGYIIMYQGSSKSDMKNKNVDKLSKRTLDYLVNSKGVPPNRLQVTNWGTAPRTHYEVWIVPPGANPPVPQ